MMKKGEEVSYSWLIWSIVILAFFVLLIFGYLISKEWKKKKQVENEISALREQSHKIEKENMNLEDRISYLNSQDYQEMQAKDKLNLQSPNEKVIVIAEGPVKKEEKRDENRPIPDKNLDETPNYKKWLNYFLN
jgi:cell division protein FtsB